MLVLARRLGESILVGEGIQITVIELHKNRVKIGIDAPKDVTILRKELICDDNKQQSASD